MSKGIAALGQQNLITQASEVGVVDYIVRPFQPNMVGEGVFNALAAGGMA